MVEALAAVVAEEVSLAVAEQGACRIALAGGGTPRALYLRLAGDPWRDRIEWGAMHVFWGDERCVPPDHPASNARMAREALLDQVPVDPAKVHPIDGTRPADEAAEAYAEVLGDAPLDLVLLGMGDDGHTASLFPGMPPSGGRQALVVATRSPRPPPDRVTLSLGAINGARRVIFLVTGGAKASRVAEVERQLRDPLGRATLPAAMVRPRHGPALWFLDSAAAADLP